MSDSLGQRLRSVREEKGLDIHTIADRTKIPSRILEALESEDLSAIPSGGYGRGIVRYFAKEVGLDGDEALRLFESLRGRRTRTPIATLGHDGTHQIAPQKPPFKKAVALIGLLAIVGGLLLYSFEPSPNPDDFPATDEQAFPVGTPIDVSQSQSNESDTTGVKVEIGAKESVTLSLSVDVGQESTVTVDSGSTITRIGDDRVSIKFFGRDWPNLSLRISNVSVGIPKDITERFDDQFVFLTIRKEDLPRIISTGNIERSRLKLESVRREAVGKVTPSPQTDTGRDERSDTPATRRQTNQPGGED
jgi:hypothetical protein